MNSIVATDDDNYLESQARVCLGLYANKGFGNPSKSRATSARYNLLEITDNAALRKKRSKVVAAVVNLVCPHPTKFRQIWHFARGAKSLYAWKPIPPDNYVALGNN